MNSLALILVIIGGINWGLIGLLNRDIITYLLGGYPFVIKILYIAIGVAAVYVLINWRRFR